MNVRYRVELDEAERSELRALVAGGNAAVRKVKRAQVLLAADRGQTDEAIARSVGGRTSTVYRTKRNFVVGNLEEALNEEPRPGAKRKLSGKEEALLVATACSTSPVGRARWTLSLLAEAVVKLTDHKELSSETVRRRLLENKLKPWRKDMWCVPEVDGEYVVFLNAHEPWRHVKVTDRRTSQDFANCMRDLVDVHYPEAELIRVVLDNLSTHSIGALYETFEPTEARRLVQKLEFHFVPKHASWLNMVEIEIGVLRGECLDRRIEDKAKLTKEIAAWERRRNKANARIKESLTVKQLGLTTGALAKTLETTNPIENLNSGIRRVAGSVKRCPHGAMALRWVGTAALECAGSFRRLKGHKDMPKLVAALRARDAKIAGADVRRAG